MIFIQILKKKKKQKKITMFNDMIAYILSNKKRNQAVTELFFRGRN